MVLLASGINMCGYLLNHMTDIHEIWLGGDAIQGDLDAVIFILLVSTILKWLRFKFQMKLE
jgi:prolipoprotein diacylglyceryltransferase